VKKPSQVSSPVMMQLPMPLGQKQWYPVLQHNGFAQLTLNVPQPWNISTGIVGQCSGVKGALKGAKIQSGKNSERNNPIYKLSYVFLSLVFFDVRRLLQNLKLVIVMVQKTSSVMP